MTRLTEAFDRAHLIQTPADPVRERVEKTGEDALRTWHFDIDGVRSTPPDRPSVKPEGAAPKFRFPDAVLNKIVLGDDADPGLVEQYRRVAAVLHHAQIEQGIRSVMVGSAIAAEGKTLTATNVALTLSHSFDRRVLLIDADLRRPSVHEMFGLPNDHGLMDTLRLPGGGRLQVHAASRNLWVLTAGRPTSDPMGHLVSEMMKQLLIDAREQFDWVIIDTPPVALMPDAKLLAAMIDAALLVVSACTTPYPLVQRAAAAIGPERILGVVLNRADRSGFVNEYGSYYGYSNRDQRKAAPPPKKRFRLLSR